MAKSFSTSALDIEKFKESMKTAAPAASAVGINVEKTTALLGTLANAGISGSMAGNALSKSFIELNKKGLTLEQGLEKVANSENKLGAAVDLVGVNAAKSFLVLAKGTDSIKELEIGLNNAGGAAEKMAKEQLDTLEGSLTILNSAWEGFVLGLLSGDSAFSSISKSIVESTTSLLGFLTASEDATEASFETALALKQEANASEDLLDEYESLVKDGVTPTKEEKEKLDIITLQLTDNLGDSILAINKETGALELNTDAVREQIKLKRFASDQEATTFASRLVGAKEEIKAIEKRQLAEAKTLKLRAEIFKQSGAEGVFILDQTKEQQNAQRGLNDALRTTQASSKELQEQKELAIDLEEKLKKLNFTAADAEALLAVKKKENLKLTQEELDALAAAEAAAEAAAKRKEKDAKDKKSASELAKELLEFEKLKEKQLLDFLEAKEKAENEFFESQLEKEKQEIRAVEEKYFNLIKQGENYNAIALENGEELVVDLTQLKEDEQSQIADIEKKYRDAKAAENAKLMAELEAQAQKEIDLAKKTAKDKAKAAAKRREEQFETAKQYLELTSEAFSEGVDKEEKEQDEAIKRREESVSLQQSRAEQGLENTLAFEKEQLAKAELERARTAEKRAKQEEALALAQAFLNAFAARAKDDPDTAAAKALTDVILAKALSETIVGAFAEGVEDFKGEGTGTSDSNLIRFSHGESVVTAKGTKENKGLTTAMNNGDVGSWFANNMMLSPLSSEKNYDSFGILAKEIKEIKQAIKNRPTSQTNLDNMGNVMQSTYRNGIKNTVKYLNARPRI